MHDLYIALKQKKCWKQNLKKKNPIFAVPGLYHPFKVSFQLWMKATIFEMLVLLIFSFFMKIHVFGSVNIFPEPRQLLILWMPFSLSLPPSSPSPLPFPLFPFPFSPSFLIPYCLSLSFCVPFPIPFFWFPSKFCSFDKIPDSMGSVNGYTGVYILCISIISPPPLPLSRKSFFFPTLWNEVGLPFWTMI